MTTKFFALPLLLALTALVLAGCAKAGLTEDKPIKSAKTSDLSVTLSSTTGELKKGENELMVTFADASGKPVEVGAASLSFHMGAMGTMAEMNDRATLTTTETPGKYRALVNLQMKGTWEAQVKYQGAHGTGQTSMSVQAK